MEHVLHAPQQGDSTFEFSGHRRLVGAEVGISIVPAMAATRHNTPQTAYVPLADHPLQREIVAVWRRGAIQTPAARAFVDSVREVVRGW